MIQIFNAIANIAVHIEKDVFKNCSDFLDNADEARMHQKVFAHCQKIIEGEFGRVKNAKEVISQDSKACCVRNEGGKYVITYKAIDNIELLDLNFSLGSIFGIYEQSIDATNLKAAVYITYGPTFGLVFASKDEGVKFFSYEGGEFVQQESLELKTKGKINSTGGYRPGWSAEHEALMRQFFDRGYRLRFSQSPALDTHQILFKKGGIYSNPATGRDPQGQFELAFEAYPLSFIIELAGGEAIDGKEAILQKPLQSLHEKTPIYFGSSEEITQVKKALK